MSGRSRTVVCLSNMAIADFLCAKREELRTEKLKLFRTVDTAFNSICDHPTPITNLHEAKQVRNIGPWILGMLKDFFDESSSFPTAEPLSQDSAGRNERAKRKYCPKIHTASYALLITLLRSHDSGKEFMRKQELIDETDKSGLSEKPIRPNKVSWNASGIPNNRDFYSGWNGMKTLIEKCLVVKSSNPAKYKLTEEGKSLARECLERSGFAQNNMPGDGLRGERVMEAGPAREDRGESSSGRQGNSDSDEDVEGTRSSGLRQRNNKHFSNPHNARYDDGLNFSSSQQNASSQTNIRCSVRSAARAW